MSIQFVPFAYDPKGLPFGFIRVMRRVARSVNVRWHAFFHELWIGRQKGKRVKSIVVAAMQRHLVRRLRFCDVVHTHLPVYKASLDRLGFNCHPLPLFSNIPCVITPPVERDGSVVEVGFFSQHAPNDVVRDWLIEFIQDAKKKGKSVRLHLAGGNQPASEKYWRASVKGLADFKAHGWMSSPDISKYLRSLDLGITTVPQHGLGKSSAIAVFAEHELPFAAPNPGFGTCGFFYSPKMLQSNVFKIDRNDVSIGRHLSLMSQNLVDS